MPIGLEQWRMQIGALEAQRYRYISRAARKAARSGRVRVGRISGGCLVGIVLCVTLLCLATSFSMQLLLAGDVERNPGPLPDELLSAVDNSELGTDDLRAVYKELHTLAGMWRTMHLSLGLPAHERNTIAATHFHNPHSCLQELLLQWLQKAYNFQRYGLPTWRMLVEAVVDPAGGNDPALAEKIAKAHQVTSQSSSLQAVAGDPPEKQQQRKQPDPRETHDLCRMFSEMFRNITKVLDKSVHVQDLKEFLYYYSHPLYPEQRFIEPTKYKHVQTTAEVLDVLFPQFINYMNHFLLEDIVNQFGCDEAKRLLQEYTGQLHDCRKRKLSTFPDPITDEEAEQLRGVKKAKVTVQGKLDDTTVGLKQITSQGTLVCTTVERVEEVKLVLEKSTGIPKAFITYSAQDPGSVILYFLIPETTCHIFHKLGGEDLSILADSGVTRLKIANEDIQLYATQKTGTKEVEYSSEDKKRGSLEYYLKERKTEIGSDKHSYLLKMLESVPSSELQKQCSETFLAHFADSLKEWKKLAPYFGINEWNYEELEERYPDVRDQNYQALMCWRRSQGYTATYHNLLETLLLHGDIEEVDVLLGIMGPDPAVLHLSELLKQKYLDYDSWHAWRDVPNLMEFDQRLGELTKDAPEMLKKLDYSDSPESVDQYPSLVTQVSLKSLINSIASRVVPVFLIKGPRNHGSSHLLGKVCQYWAKGFGLRRFTLVLWMNLMSLKTSVNSLEGLLVQVIPEGIVKDVCWWVLTRNGKDVLFLLDGWHHSVKQGSIFSKLVSRQDLTESTVVVTSTFTPKAMPINQYIQYEMMGLTHTQISKQIIRYHELNSTRAEELLQYLASTPDMQLLSHTPVNLYAILFVSQSIPPSDPDFSHSKTQFFMTLTVLLLQQTFPEHQLLSRLSSLRIAYSEGQLPPPVHTFLDKLSQEAMYSLGLRDSHGDIDPLLPGRPTGFTFVHLEEPPLANNQCVKFIFHDLIDFLAALRIHYLSESRWLGRLKVKEALRNRNTFPWSFFAGLCKYKHLSILSSLLEKHCANNIKKLASCAYEANVMVNIPNTIRGYILTTADIHLIIAASQNIREMIFDSCCLGTDASVHLSKLHRYFHPQLPATGYSEHHLQFLHCVFSEEGLDYLRVTTVEEIKLQGLSIKQLQTFSSGYGEHLGPRSLNLTDNEIDDSGARALAKGLCHYNSLQELNLGGNEIRYKGATALSEALRVNYTLRTLNLANNKIHDSGVRALAEGLCHNNFLQELDLANNEIHDSGARALAEGLCHNNSLQELDLADNMIHVSGARALAEGLCRNNSLQELDLSGSVIGDEGANALSKALKVNHTLRTLNLANNRIQDSGAQALAEGLCHNNSLQELDLRVNGIRDDGTTALCEALRVNHTLRTLKLPRWYMEHSIWSEHEGRVTAED